MEWEWKLTNMLILGIKKQPCETQSCLKCYLYVSSSFAMNAPSHVPNPNITTQARY